MTLITVATIYHTLSIGVIVLIAQGWFYSKDRLSRVDVTYLTLVIGITYISYSSQFITAQMNNMDKIVDIWMAIYNIFILIHITRTCL